MKKLTIEIPVSGSFFSESTFTQSGGIFSGQPGMKKLNQMRVPSDLRGDEVLGSLIGQYRVDWLAFKARSQELRKQLIKSAEGDRAVLAEILQDLMRSNQHTQSNFMRAMRERMRELRLGGEE